MYAAAINAYSLTVICLFYWSHRAVSVTMGGRTALERRGELTTVLKLLLLLNSSRSSLWGS